MKDNYHTHSFQATQTQKRILGLPERHFYRLGVVFFYAILFFMISYFSQRMHSTAGQIPETGETIQGK